MEKRISIAVYCVLFLLGLLVTRLWYLQILRGSDYRLIEQHNRQRVLNIMPRRGLIYDRHGRALVKNFPSIDSTIVREKAPKATVSISALGKITGLEDAQIRKKLSSRTRKPFQDITLREDVSFEDVARIEARKIDFPGLQIKVVSGREYIYGKASSHVLGYIGSMSVQQMNLPEYRNAPAESVIGQFGIEKVMDSTMLGIAGRKVIEVDAVGRIMKVVRIQRPISGSDVHLSIDVDLQVESDRSLQGHAGAVVALKVNTGEVLALQRAPAFDPNVFVLAIRRRYLKRVFREPNTPMR